MKTIINLDSTALGNATCERALYLTVIGSIDPKTNQSEGGYKTLMPASAIYGVALHKYIDLMYKTRGRIDIARQGALISFNRPKLQPGKTQQWLDDEKHLLTVCYEVWENYCLKDDSYQLLQIPVKCWKCDGHGQPVTKQEDGSFIALDMICDTCAGKGHIDGPSTELTFKIPFYEDDYVIINLCGTIDKLGKFAGGIYSIGDWKSTSSWDKEKYLDQYKLNRQLRVYRLACKLEATRNPTSALGKIGNTNVGGFIDGIFLSAKPNDVNVMRSEVYQFDDNKIKKFENSLINACKDLSTMVKEETNGEMTGILNGACTNVFGKEGIGGKCKFWSVCANDGPVGDMLLARDFTRKIYEPLSFNED